MASDIREELRSLLAQRILILEGPKGTMLQTVGLDEKDYRGDRFTDHPIPLRNNNEILNLTRPEVVASIHRGFARAGADILTTNTFNGNRLSQTDFGLEEYVAEMNGAAVRIARGVAAETERDTGKRLFVAGSIGPTPRMASMSPDVNDPGYRAVTFDDLVAIYAEQIRSFLSEGVDLLIFETTFDTLNLKAGLYAASREAERCSTMPEVIASVTFSDRSGRTLSGQTLEAFVASIDHYPLLAIGINCGLGAEELRAQIEELAAICPTYTACYPNAGLPNAVGGYDQTPEEMSRILGDYAANGWLNIAGGCCGSSPEHIAAIAEAVRQGKPRRAPEPRAMPRYAGLDLFTIRPDSNFTVIGERTNVTGSRKFARLIRGRRYEEAVAVARNQVEGGANIVDVNMDEALLDSAVAMREFLCVLSADPDVARPPIMVDSSDWEVILAGLKAVQGKCIVNSVSLKDGEEAFLDRAREARRFGAALVVMAFDEHGQADTLERRVAVCRRAYDLLVQRLGVPPHDIIFDPNVLAIGTGIAEHADYARDFIESLRKIKELCPGALCSGGISNLSFSFRGNDHIREAIHSVFLYHAIHAGLDMGIVNAGQLTVLEEIEPELRELAEDLVLNRRADATERLLEYSLRTDGGGAAAEQAAEADREEVSLDDRIASSLIRGVTDTIDAEMEEALGVYGSALAVIEGPLMAAMRIIGDRFGDGRMFLPQVVKSARTMKRAVAWLEPYMQRTGSGDERPEGSARILLATVKGDVHDIGKNIVGVVLACAGHEIIDMGVMAPAADILDTADARGADIIGLSGLITPSLEEMAHVAEEMQRRGMQKPLLIGGATTSRAHTAIRIAPGYEGPVVYVEDASRAGPVVKRLMSATERDGFLIENRAELANARERYERRHSEKSQISYAEALRRRPEVSWSPETIAEPSFLGAREAAGASVAVMRPFIDWTPFFHVWGLRGRYPDILTQPEIGPRADELYRDAQILLDELETVEEVVPKGVYGFFPAYAEGDDVILPGSTAQDAPKAVFHLLRQQADKGPGQVNYGLADFIAPRSSGLTDYLGMFVVTAGDHIHRMAQMARDGMDDYRGILLEALADRLAEAFAEWLHLQARRACGFGLTEGLSHEDLIGERYRGIRPAPGYPACPDHSEKPVIFQLLDAEARTGVRLTDSMAMGPPSSVCGFYINHPAARYFPVGRIGQDQLESYASRRGMTIEEARKWLAPALAA